MAFGITACLATLKINVDYYINKKLGFKKQLEEKGGGGGMLLVSLWGGGGGGGRGCSIDRAGVSFDAEQNGRNLGGAVGRLGWGWGRRGGWRERGGGGREGGGRERGGGERESSISLLHKPHNQWNINNTAAASDVG